MWNSQLLVICCGREGGGVRGRGIPSREGAVESRGHSIWHTHTHTHIQTHMNTFRHTCTQWMCCHRREGEREAFRNRSRRWRSSADLSERNKKTEHISQSSVCLCESVFRRKHSLEVCAPVCILEERSACLLPRGKIHNDLENLGNLRDFFLQALAGILFGILWICDLLRKSCFFP